MTLTAHVRATLGSKFEHDSGSGWDMQPTARIIWDVGPSGQHLWASVSHALRTPAPYDTSLQISAPLPPVNGVPAQLSVSGNPDYPTERLDDVEMHPARVERVVVGDLRAVVGERDPPGQAGIFRSEHPRIPSGGVDGERIAMINARPTAARLNVDGSGATRMRLFSSKLSATSLADAITDSRFVRMPPSFSA